MEHRRRRTAGTGRLEKGKESMPLMMPGAAMLLLLLWMMMLLVVVIDAGVGGSARAVAAGTGTRAGS